MSYSDYKIKVLESSEQSSSHRRKKTNHTKKSHVKKIDKENFLSSGEISTDKRITRKSSSKEENIRTDSHMELLKYANKQSQLQSSVFNRNKKANNYIYNLLITKCRGCKVNVLIQGTGIISGEVVLNFDKILALKHENTIVFISAEFISAFY